MRRLILPFSILLLTLEIAAQNCLAPSIPSISNDSIYFYIENFQTTNIEYFNLDTTEIESVVVIKNEKLKEIYSTNEGKVMINLKANYFRGLKLGQILKPDLSNVRNLLFYVNGNLSPKKKFLNFKIKNLEKIVFVKRNLEIYQINLTLRHK